jgi:hypothetical protein
MNVWHGGCRDRIRKCLIALDGIASSGDLVRYCWPRRSRFSNEVGEADSVMLREHGFSDDDIWDIAAISAFFGMSNRLANFTSLRPNDEFYALGRS